MSAKEKTGNGLFHCYDALFIFKDDVPGCNHHFESAAVFSPHQRKIIVKRRDNEMVVTIKLDWVDEINDLIVYKEVERSEKLASVPRKSK